MNHVLRLGDAGVARGPAHYAPDEALVQFDRTYSLATLRIPRAALVPEGKAMSKFRFGDKCSDTVRKDSLRKLGVRDPRDEVLPSTTEFALAMWGEYAQIGLRLNESHKLKFIQPYFVQAFEAGHDLTKRVEVGEFSLSVE